MNDRHLAIGTLLVSLVAGLVVVLLMDGGHPGPGRDPVSSSDTPAAVSDRGDLGPRASPNRVSGPKDASGPSPDAAASGAALNDDSHPAVRGSGVPTGAEEPARGPVANPSASPRPTTDAEPCCDTHATAHPDRDTNAFAIAPAVIDAAPTPTPMPTPEPTPIPVTSPTPLPSPVSTPTPEPTGLCLPIIGCL
jgi:hypothetical protein